MKVALVLLLAFVGVLAAPPKIERSVNPLRTGRITGGQDAERYDFPYQVSFQWGILGIFQHVCGGSIVSPNYVVTAAHCITELPAIGSFRIVAGILNLNENIAESQTINVASSVVHPDYQGGVNPNDIAVLRLASALSYTQAVQPIALPSAGAVATGSSVLSGWGSTSTTVIPNMPNRLQTATLPLLSLTECANALTDLFGTSDPLASSNVCTGPLTGGISACSGDSGGPLAQDGVLIGVVSWGVSPCGTTGAPSVYTQVSSFTSWLADNIPDLP